MSQLLDSNLELAVQAGFVYLPLLRDPSGEREIGERTSPSRARSGSGLQDSETILSAQGRYFVRTLSLQTLVRNYAVIDPRAHEELMVACRKKYHLAPNLEALSPDGKLLTILFRIMPYFVRKSRGFERKSLAEQEIIDLVSSKVRIPAKYREEASSFLNIEALRAKLRDLHGEDSTTQPPADGLIKAHELREWLHKAIDQEILAREKESLNRVLQVGEQLRQAGRKRIGTLLYVAEKGSLEMDGFGFSRIGTRDEYLIFKRTGEYILKDYYGRSYLFPDCRVGVSSAGPFMPMVVETYKHPFLFGFDSGQEICLRGYKAPRDFTAESIIQVLEDGFNALLYGYDARRRNGYHSLDRVTKHVRTIDFDDYRIS